jgi:hypothetical protein
MKHLLATMKVQTNIIDTMMLRITLAGFAKDTCRRFIRQSFDMEYWGTKL